MISPTTICVIIVISVLGVWGSLILITRAIKERRHEAKWEAYKEEVRVGYETGTKALYVLVAPSGRGTVMHSYSCHVLRASKPIEYTEALAQGYRECSKCGGTTRLLDTQ